MANCEKSSCTWFDEYTYSTKIWFVDFSDKVFKEFSYLSRWFGSGYSRFMRCYRRISIRVRIGYSFGIPNGFLNRCTGVQTAIEANSLGVSLA
jgi:hypothetical protein